MEFLTTIQRPGHKIRKVTDDQNLIREGLTDSLAILQIVSYLEEDHSVDFSERGADPDELSSVGGILNDIEQNRELWQSCWAGTARYRSFTSSRS